MQSRRRLSRECHHGRRQDEAVRSPFHRRPTAAVRHEDGAIREGPAQGLSRVSARGWSHDQGEGQPWDRALQFRVAMRPSYHWQ